MLVMDLPCVMQVSSSSFEGPLSTAFAHAVLCCAGAGMRRGIIMFTTRDVIDYVLGSDVT